MATYKHLSIETKDRVAVITMQREPVNSMNADFWEELLSSLMWAENSTGVRGIIYRSGVKRDVFTAGNDIKELYAPMTNQQQHRRFWRAQTLFLARLYRSPLATVASIRGACPAGGCVLALCCDYRVMADLKSSKIGLNEVALGIAPPTYWAKVMISLVGYGKAEVLLKNAVMVPAKQALAIGLINRVVSKEDLDSVAATYMKSLLRLPAVSYGITKVNLRGDLGNAWEAQADEEAKNGWAFLNLPQTTKMLGGVLKRLSGNKHRKKSKQAPKAKL